VWHIESDGNSSAAAAAADANVDGDHGTDAGDWTLSVQPAAMERDNVEAEVIAVSRRLTDQPTNLTFAQQKRLQETQKRRKPGTKSTSEISVAQVLASLATGPVEPGQSAPTTSTCMRSAKNQLPIKHKETAAAKNDKRKNNVRISKTGELSTINMSDVKGLGVPSTHASANNVPRHLTSDSTVPLPDSILQSLAVTSPTAAVSSKHSFYRPMKQAPEVQITYDETAKRYVQTVRKSTDRRKSLGFPGFQADDASCRRSLPIVVNGSVETKENETMNAAANVGDNCRHRLSRRKDQVTPLHTSGESDLSSMEIVTRCLLGTTETRTLAENSQQSEAVKTIGIGTAMDKTRRSSSQPAGKVSKCSTSSSEPVTSNPSTVNVRIKDEVDQSSSLFSVDARSRTATKNSAKRTKGSDTKSMTTKARQTKKSLEKVRSQSLPHESDFSPLGSTKLNVEKQQPGRRRAKKSAVTSKEKKCARDGGTMSAVDPQTEVLPPISTFIVPLLSPIKVRQTSALKNDKKNNRQTECGVVNDENVSDVNGSGDNVPANGVSKRPSTSRKGRKPGNKADSPSEVPRCTDGELALPVKRKLRSSSLVRVKAEPGHGSEHQDENDAVSLPDSKSCLTSPSAVGKDSVTTDMVTDLSVSKNIDETVDGSSLQNNCTSSQPVVSTPSSMDAPMSKEHAERSSPAICTSHLLTSTSSPDSPKSYAVSIPLPSSPKSSDMCMTDRSADDMHHATVSNVSHQEREPDLISGLSSHHSVENHVSISNSTTSLSGQYT